MKERKNKRKKERRKKPFEHDIKKKQGIRNLLEKNLSKSRRMKINSFRQEVPT
jgi:hypothetical protein